MLLVARDAGDLVRIVHEYDVRARGLGLLGIYLRIAHDDDLVAHLDTMSRGAVQADHAAAALAGDGVGLQAAAVVDVGDLHALVLQDAGSVHEVLIDGDGTDVVHLGLFDRGAVDLAFQHVEHHLA